MELTSTLVVGALSGAVAAFGIRFILKWIQRRKVDKKPLKTYKCGEPNPLFLDGLVWHGWGEKHGCVWMHTGKDLTGPKGKEKYEHTVFGPYFNDFGRPGYYKIVFSMAKRLGEDRGFEVHLDVVERPRRKGEDFSRLGQLKVSSDQLTATFSPFSFVFYSIGAGTFEYRAAVRPQKLPRVPGQDKRGPRVLFDTIQVFPHIPWFEVIS